MSPRQHQTTTTGLDDQPIRCVTIDVEEYFHIEAARGTIARGDWNNWPSRVEASVDMLLDLFERHGQCGTFFVLGDVAQKHPRLARRICDAGHEVASHGMGHDRLHNLTVDRFRQDVSASKSLLEDQTGRGVLGYRAPTFSVVPQTAWAIDVLAEVGFVYDSSVYPVRHPWYGVPSAPAGPFLVQGQPGGVRFLEVPPLTWRVRTVPWRGAENLAVGGGGYFRLLPLWFMCRGLAQAAAEKRPAVLYFHPWEFDTGLPRMRLSALGRLRTYTGLRSAARRLGRVMGQPARWGPIAESLDALRRIAEGSPAYCLRPGS